MSIFGGNLPSFASQKTSIGTSSLQIILGIKFVVHGSLWLNEKGVKHKWQNFVSSSVLHLAVTSQTLVPVSVFLSHRIRSYLFWAGRWGMQMELILDFLKQFHGEFLKKDKCYRIFWWVSLNFRLLRSCMHDLFRSCQQKISLWASLKKMVSEVVVKLSLNIEENRAGCYNLHIICM